ncbi:hypothetical protein E2C01_024700 [Portunus trituberculatus]|uniref:Uncharacterized protein n=1 Tax=Portunus trituberculatus TaxID=210409 RepID=A0A5B7EBH4_PORTR|nr:hypothetical protein [Portunus trituberculatus]
MVHVRSSGHGAANRGVKARNLTPRSSLTKKFKNSKHFSMYSLYFARCSLLILSPCRSTRSHNGADGRGGTHARVGESFSRAVTHAAGRVMCSGSPRKVHLAPSSRPQPGLHLGGLRDGREMRGLLTWIFVMLLDQHRTILFHSSGARNPIRRLSSEC